MTPCRVLSSGVGTGCSKMREVWLANREDLRVDHSIGAFREKICENAWNEDRLCNGHVSEGCRSCDSMPRPSREEWQRHIAKCQLSLRDRAWIGKYESSL